MIPISQLRLPHQGLLPPPMANIPTPRPLSHARPAGIFISPYSPHNSRRRGRLSAPDVFSPSHNFNFKRNPSSAFDSFLPNLPYRRMTSHAETTDASEHPQTSVSSLSIPRRRSSSGHSPEMSPPQSTPECTPPRRLSLESSQNVLHKTSSHFSIQRSPAIDARTESELRRKSPLSFSSSAQSPSSSLHSSLQRANHQYSRCIGEKSNKSTTATNSDGMSLKHQSRLSPQKHPSIYDKNQIEVSKSPEIATHSPKSQQPPITGFKPINPFLNPLGKILPRNIGLSSTSTHIPLPSGTNKRSPTISASSSSISSLSSPNVGQSANLMPLSPFLTPLPKIASPFMMTPEEQQQYIAMLSLQENMSTDAAQSFKSQINQNMSSRNYLELAMLVCNTFRGKLFPCPHCRYVTDRRNNLKRHVATMHQACDKQLECCGVAFATKASLREHIAIFHHNGYSCTFCGRRFCRKALLKRHLSVHNGQKDYICPHCDYATSHKSNLERHKRIHTRLPGDPFLPEFDADDQSPHSNNFPAENHSTSRFHEDHDDVVMDDNEHEKDEPDVKVRNRDVWLNNIATQSFLHGPSRTLEAGEIDKGRFNHFSNMETLTANMCNTQQSSLSLSSAITSSSSSSSLPPSSSSSFLSQSSTPTQPFIHPSIATSSWPYHYYYNYERLRQMNGFLPLNFQLSASPATFPNLPDTTKQLQQQQQQQQPENDNKNSKHRTTEENNNDIELSSPEINRLSQTDKPSFFRHPCYKLKDTQSEIDENLDQISKNSKNIATNSTPNSNKLFANHDIEMNNTNSDSDTDIDIDSFDDDDDHIDKNVKIIVNTLVSSSTSTLNVTTRAQDDEKLENKDDDELRGGNRRNNKHGNEFDKEINVRDVPLNLVTNRAENK